MDNATAPPDTAPDSSSGSTTAGGNPPESTSPIQPTEADVPLLSASQELEFTIRDLYDAALDAGLIDDESTPVFVTMRENHEEYANAISGLLGLDAPQHRNDELYDELLPHFDTGDRASVIAAAYDLESQAVATNLDIVSRLDGLDGATTVSSYLIVESEHCTVLADMAGKGEDLAAMLDNTAETRLRVGVASTSEPSSSAPSSSDGGSTEPGSTVADATSPGSSAPETSAPATSAPATTEG